MAKNQPAAVPAVVDAPVVDAPEVVAPDVAAPDTPDVPDTKAATVKARVLVDGLYGKVDDVVEVTQAEADASSELDSDADAVAYAESLKA